ncbi:hypothetical protein QUF80_07185 [Desulfococcaceae bacterium HSG8]|nr:hypothetical protein [Desulfococcaceae bacterium HSG8]
MRVMIFSEAFIRRHSWQFLSDLYCRDRRKSHLSRITYHVSRITYHVSRITHHASRITHHASRITLKRISLPSLEECHSFNFT